MKFVVSSSALLGLLQTTNKVISSKNTLPILDYFLFDLKEGVLKITASDWNLDVYVITGTDVKDIVHQFRQLIGRSFVVPKWAFGYGQSRWSYMSQDDIRDVVKTHRENHIPLRPKMPARYGKHHHGLRSARTHYPNSAPAE